MAWRLARDFAERPESLFRASQAPDEYEAASWPEELPEARRRLLFAVNDCGFFLSHRLPLAESARGAGYDVHVAALDDGNAPELTRRGIAFHPLPVDRHAMNPLAELRLQAAFLRLLRRLRPHIVHNVAIKAALYGGIAARLAGVPASVAAVAGTGYLFENAGWKRALVRGALSPLFRFAMSHPNGKVIFQNSDDAARFASAGFVTQERTRLIPGSGVNLREFRPVPPPQGAPTILFAGRLLRSKGVEIFAKAARLLREQAIEARCVVCGSPPAHNRDAVRKEELEAWMRAGHIEWWGHRTDMAAVLAGANIVCLPSHYGEGLPKILIEAAAAGRPVITTDWPGCRDAIEDGVTGFLVPVKSPEALAARLAELCANRGLAERMGAAGRKRAEAMFDIDDVIRRTLAIYAELTSRPFPARF